MPPTVLVIDDEKTFRVVAAEALRAERFEVCVAATGTAGLDAFRREHFDVVMLDRHLPDMDGMNVLRALLDDAARPLVVVASADADGAGASQALGLGAFEYLTKPVRLRLLVSTFRRALEAKGWMRGADPG